MESREWDEMLQRVKIMTDIAKLRLYYFIPRLISPLFHYCLSFVPWWSHFPSPIDFPHFCSISNPKICSVRPERAQSGLYARSSVCFRWIRERGWQLTKLLTKWLGICAGSLHWNKNVMKLQFKSSDMSGRGDHLKTLPGVLSSLTKTWLSTISGDL